VGLVPPELISPIRNSNILEVKENFYKADVFSLGLTLLEAATLKRSTDIYDTKGSQQTIGIYFFRNDHYLLSSI